MFVDIRRHQTEERDVLAYIRKPVSGFAADEGRVLFDRRLWPFYSVIGAFVVIMISTVVTGLFSYEPSPLNALLIFAIGLCCVGAAARWLTVYCIANLFEALGLFVAFGAATSLTAAILASSNMPLADPWLAWLDHRLFLGFDRQDFVDLVSRSRFVLRLLSFAYCSIAWQPILLLSLLFLTGKAARGWWFLGAWFAALMMTLVIFPFAPAISALDHQADTWVVALKNIRDGELRVFGVPMLAGIIAFPSFHAAASVLLGWGFVAFGRRGVPLILLNVTMFFSAIVDGGHYFVDLAAGGLVAIAAIRMVGMWSVSRESGERAEDVSPRVRRARSVRSR